MRNMLNFSVAFLAFSGAGCGAMTAGNQPPPPQASNCSSLSIGQGANLGGFVPFPSDSLWNQEVSSVPVDANSSAIISFIGSGTFMPVDFGAGQYLGSTIGIPYLVVGGQQPPVTINFTAYGSESDPGPMPVPITAPIEGYPNPGAGDRHVLVLDNSNCFLYELSSSYVSGNSWNVGSGAVWDLLSNEQRPYTWTSADAAGLPIFPGLARYDEVAAGAINHALRFTVPTTQKAFVAPASHWASTVTNTSAPPMGTRLRLKASFDISGFPADDLVILTALKKYGMILADNGSGIFISGAPDNRWNNTDLNLLKTITASDFEVVQMGTISTPANVPTGPAPTISFTSNPTTVFKGGVVTLSWNTSGAEYNIISPQIGATRVTSLTVSPAVTTTYTLYSTNQYGRSVATVTVTVL